jgi:colanic acid/amylovoran biosynthesis protein
MVKVIVTGAYCVCNKGDAALRLGGLPSLKQEMPDIEFLILTLYPEIDKKIYKNWEVKPAISSINGAISSMTRCLLLNILRNKLNLKDNMLNRLSNVDVIRDYLASDIVLDISGDSISEVTGFKGTCYHFVHLYIPLLLNKPIIIYSQSVGPFKYTMPFAKYLLNRVDLITLRGQKSFDYLRSIGITNPKMYLTADLAFLMDAGDDQTTEGIMKANKIRKPFIGVSVSHLIANYYGSHEKFVNLMANVVDYVIDNFNVDVVFIPHVTGPMRENDDRIIASEVYNKLDHKDRAKLISDDLTPQEIKGIIGKGELFVGSRMHACIAALSMGVPTINISYHHKSSEIMAMFGLDQNVIGAKDLDYDTLIAKIKGTWEKRDSIRESIKINLVDVRSKSDTNAKLVKAYLNDIVRV